VRLFTTIVRFDVVYVQHFKTNIRDIRSGYPYIHKWLRHLYWNVPAFKDTTEFTHIKNHYTKSHTQVRFLLSVCKDRRFNANEKQINQFSITPVGPELPILKEDEEVPAVKYALALAARK
jgi:putative glutathione S-transferase